MDRYQIEELLGKGGMGEVYRCWDRATQREVALKRIRKEQRSRLENIKRFFYREARVMASLRHPNLVRVYDVGLLRGGQPFLAMEYVRGITLGDMAWRMPLFPWPLLGVIVDQILAGLAHIHARGICHRDIKPGNIMLRTSPTSVLPHVLILDFGVAIQQDDQQDEYDTLIGDESQKKLIPRSEASFVTPPYAAPEQIQKPFFYRGPATDLYALGILIYQLCTGDLPYLGKHTNETMNNIIMMPIPTFAPRNNAPSEVSAVVKGLLAKKPWNRIEFAAEVRQRFTGLWQPEEAATYWADFLEVLTLEEEERAQKEVNENSATQPLSDSFEPYLTVENTFYGEPFGGEWWEEDEEETPPEHRPSPEMLPLRFPVLNGRRQEKALLREEILRICQEGGRRLLVLEGEAGIGKSRLAQWAMETCHEEGWMVGLRASYRRREGARGGLIGAVERFFSLHDAHRNNIEHVLLERWGYDETTCDLVAEVAELLRPRAHGEKGQMGPSNKRVIVDRSEVRVRLLYQVLQRMTTQRPLLLWIDNFEAAEQELSELLKVIQEEGQMNLLVLATVRQESLSEPSLADTLEELLSLWQGERLLLEPLKRQDIAELLHDLMKLEEETLETLFERSRGNPLFVLQHAYSWVLEQRLWWDEEDQCYRIDSDSLHEQPQTTRELWNRRLSVLSAEAHKAALAATTLGDEFPAALLEHLLERLRLPVQDCLQELTRHQLLLFEEEQISWSHGLLEDHLANELSEELAAPSIYRLAAHLLQEGPLAHTRHTVRLCVQNLLAAGDDEEAYRRMMDFVVAEWQMRRDGMLVSEDLLLLQGRVPPAHEAEWWRWRAEASLARSAHTGAEEAAQEALARYQGQEEPLGEAHCLYLLASVHNAWGLYQEAATEAQQALAVFEKHEERLSQAETTYLLGFIGYTLSQYTEAEEFSLAALELFAQSEDLRGQSQCRTLLGYINGDRGRYNEAVQWANQALAPFEAMGHRLGEAQCRFLLGWFAFNCGELDEAANQARYAARLFDELSEFWWVTAVLILQSRLACRQEDFPRARQLAQNAQDNFRAMELQMEEGQAMLLHVAIDLLQGDLEQANTLLSEIESWERIEPILMQPLYLTRAWWGQLASQPEAAVGAFAYGAGYWQELQLTSFGVPWLLEQLAPFPWPPAYEDILHAWRRSLQN